MHSRRIALWLLHLSIAVVLCGGILTSLTEKRGRIHLRCGETTHEFLANTSGNGWEPTTLPFYLTLTGFNIETDGEAHTDYVSSVRLSRTRPLEHSAAVGMDIRMNRPLLLQGYRILQAGYDPDHRGSHLRVVHDPYGTRIVMAGYALLLLSLLVLLYSSTADLARKPHSPLKALCLLPFTFAATLPLLPLAATPLQPILRTPLLYVHVGIVILSYVLLASTLVWRTLLRPAVLLLGIGIILGSIWGAISWGTYWSWDPKETCALITLVLYALPLHSRVEALLAHPWAWRAYSMLCLLSLLVTYLGVNFFMQSQHSYLG